MAREYMNVLTTYGCYAKSLWHADAPTGYWGDGIAAKNQNGAVRGMCNTMLTYVMLARGLDNNWIAPEDRAKLEACGLSRDELTSYARAQLDYLIAHHKSTTPPVQPQWGFWWQSPLWLGAVAPAVMLSWDELSPQQRAEITRIAGVEADRIAAMPPKDYVVAQGDTGAEENGWNMGAPAMALALAPKDPRADTWWRALKVYAVNTYSHPRDRTSTATVGTDKVSALVSTASLLPDWTLFNHGFFHPDYVQVSGQHLGEAWMILGLGDKMHGTKRAEEFLPYALHNVREVWENVSKPLLLPSGEFAYPNGNDWTYHCSTIQSYLAFIAEALGDPVAAAGEREGIKHVQRRREVSPPGRLLGDSNLEWWWEPLVCKRASTALLQHELAAAAGKLNEPQRHRDAEKSTEQKAKTWFYPDAKVWVHRNDKYLVTAAWGKKRMGSVYPLCGNSNDIDSTSCIYMSVPFEQGILPDDLTTATAHSLPPDGTNTAFDWSSPLSPRAREIPLLFLYGKGTDCAVICLPASVVFVSNTELRALGIENDSLTTPGRMIGGALVGALDSSSTINLAEHVVVDDLITVSNTNGFEYRTAGKWTRKSAAIDQLKPLGEPGLMQVTFSAGPHDGYPHLVGSTLMSRDLSNGLINSFNLRFLAERYSRNNPVSWTMMKESLE